MSEGVDKEQTRRDAARVLLARISCILGILFGAGGILFALFGASVNVSSGAVGAALGIVGYFLGTRWLGAFTIVLGVITVFFVEQSKATTKYGRKRGEAEALLTSEARRSRPSVLTRRLAKPAPC